MLLTTANQTKYLIQIKKNIPFLQRSILQIHYSGDHFEVERDSNPYNEETYLYASHSLQHTNSRKYLMDHHRGSVAINRATTIAQI